MFSSWAIANSALTPAAVWVYSPHTMIIWLTARIRVRTLAFQLPVSGSLTDQSASPRPWSGLAASPWSWACSSCSPFRI